MPRLPTYTPQTRITGNLRRLPEESGGQRQARALSGAAQATRNFADVMAEREAQKEVSRLTNNLSDLQIEFQRTLEESLQTAGRDDDVVETVNTTMSDRLGALRENVSTRAGQKYLDTNAAKLQTHFLQSAMTAQAELRSTFAAEDYSESLNKWSSTIIEDPESLDMTMELHETAVEALGDTYGLSARRRSELRRMGDKTLTRAALRGSIRQSPSTALARLRESPIPNIDPNEQQEWIGKAVTAVEQERRAQLQAEEELERRREERLERVQNETAKQGWELLARNELGAQWVFNNRDNLNKTDYKLLLDKAAGDPDSVETDVEVYADLRTRAGAGEDVTRDARLALESNQIKVSDFNNILNEVETNAPQAQMPNWYDQGRSYIRGQIGGENANPFDLQVQSRVLDDWTRWAREHPEASIEDARDKYREYANEGLLIRGNTVGLPVPKFFAGTRQDPDLGATYRELKKAREQDEISEFEYQRQLRLIDDWQQRIEAQQRLQSRPKKTEGQ